jgi:uncharacterized protein YyaL (SSP411 family)
MRFSMQRTEIGLWIIVLVFSFAAGLAVDFFGSNLHNMSLTSLSIQQKMHDRQHPNRLINEKSPYLLQHAFNPVDWYPWGEEAIEKARRENKPIFLSVGYSTCYWCHVMEREVFENDEIAKLMNENLVCIKVDREERPDIDRVYMNALQAMTGSGGWPMSMFLTPDLKPFFGGTYIPPRSSYGRPGFPDLVNQITMLWKTDRNKLLESGDKITEYLKSSITSHGRTEVPASILDSAYRVFEKSFDRLHGGFGSAPKFPRPIALEFLLRYYHRTGNDSALSMVLGTLRQMANGGVYDQIGGGFHRYSVDAEWRVPHFEKMLYDQAQLAILYIEAYQITNDEFYKTTSRDILRYVMQNMTDTLGGFYSAEDAESAPDPARPDEKEEGTFYLWTKSELVHILGNQTAEIFCYRYGINDSGNAPHDPMNVFAGKNILFCAHPIEETDKQFDRSTGTIGDILREAREKLATVRLQRPRPHLDDKIITAWNGLMISAFAKAYQVFKDPEYLGTAERAARFTMTHLYDGQILYRRYRDNDRRFEGTLQDYSFLITGLLDLYESSFHTAWLEHAIELTEIQNRLFWDMNNGGFFDNSGNDATILLKTKENYDGAEPSGNSIATLNLLRLGQLTDNSRWKEMAQQTVNAFGGSLIHYSESMPGLLIVMEWLSSVPNEIIIVGNRNDSATNILLNVVYDTFLPNKVLILADGSEQQKSVLTSLPFLNGMMMSGSKATAYVCQNYACQLPTTDPTVLGELLSGEKQRKDQHKTREFKPQNGQ